MANERQQILEILNTPKTREEVNSKLCAVSDAFLAFRGSGAKLGLAAEADWKAIIDFMLYMDRDTGKINDDGVPQTDPLTVITAAERYQVLNKDTADRLRADFMRRVQAIAGTGLEPFQMKKLFRLCVEYNPVKALNLDKGPNP